MYKKIIATLSLLVACTFSANAALVKIESASAAFGNNINVDLASYWMGLDDSDITTRPFNEATLLFNGRANNNTIYKMTINLFPGNDLSLSLFAGLDAGHGAELYQNDVLVADINSNLWWGRSWANSQVIAQENMAVNAGRNQFAFYWAENGNSGGNSFEFSVNNGQRLALSAVNLQAEVPAPSTVGIFSVMLIGLGLFGRKMR